MLAQSHARQPAPPLAARGMWLRLGVGADAFGSALGETIGAVVKADAAQGQQAQQQSYKPLTQGDIDYFLSDLDPVATSYPVRMPGEIEARALPPSQTRSEFVDKYFDAKEAQAARDARARLPEINRRNDAYGKQLAQRAAAQRSTDSAKFLLDHYSAGGLAGQTFDGVIVQGSERLLGTPMPMKLGNGGQWVANPDHPNYIVPPVAYQGQDSNFLGFVKEGVSSYSADAVVWGGRNGGALGTGAAFLGYTGLVAGELLPGSATELALGAFGGPIVGKGLGLAAEAAVSRFPVLGKSVSELWSGGAEQGIFGARGPFSGRPFEPAEAGGPLRNLSTDGVKITDRGIDVVEKHTARFGPDDANNYMADRLRQIARGDLPSTQSDLNYYTHELREYTRYRRLGWESGQPSDPMAARDLWNNTHSATLEEYRLRDGMLYHPEAPQ